MISKATITLCVSLALFGCSGATITRCPPIVPYSPNEQDVAAAELATLPDSSEVKHMVSDYLRERDELRACQ